MKKILFILGIAVGFYAQAQQTIINYKSPDTMNYPIIYGLDTAKYISKARQVDQRKFPTYVSISFKMDHGSRSSIRDNAEFFFDGSIGYILHSKKGKPDLYFEYTNRNLVVGIINILNQTFAFDSTILLETPYSHHNPKTGFVCGFLEIDILYTDGEQVSNKVHFGGINNYSKYLPTLYHYLIELKQDSCLKLNYNVSKKILSKFNSRIASNFLENINKEIAHP